MQEKTVKALLSRFLRYTEAEVINTFASLPNAQVPDNRAYVYIPGSRSDRILLVAHADTVNGTSIPEICWMGDVCTLDIFWRDKNVYDKDLHGHFHNSGLRSLGADDRTGCAALWNLHNGDHSILITTGEETGCAGARAATRDLAEELKKHSFAVEIDRRGDRQAVFYDVSTEPFEDYVLDALSKADPDGIEWLEEPGSSTDIRHICGELRMCGVNLSAGYVNEHSKMEHLYLEAWTHTLETTRKVLSLKKHVEFVLPARPAVVPYYRQGQPQERLAKVVDSLTGTTKVRIARMDGTEPGEGYVLLVDAADRIAQVISKRRAKKLMQLAQKLLFKKKINQEEAARLVERIIELRDQKPGIITEAQRETRLAGEYDQSGVTTPPKSDISPAGVYHWCWHYCGNPECHIKWWHMQVVGVGCRASYTCLCPVHSPSMVVALIGGPEVKWGFDPAVTYCAAAVQQTVQPKKTPGGYTSCIHCCRTCEDTWSHKKPLAASGRCKAGDASGALCPSHSFQTFQIVRDYNIQVGAALEEYRPRVGKKPASEGDPHDAAPEEFTKKECAHGVSMSVKCQSCLDGVLDGKTGTGLKPHVREGEQLN